MYINVNSNHSPESRRISKLSADATLFYNSKDMYSYALSKSGFKDKIHFHSKNYIQNPRKNERIRGKKCYMVKTAMWS